MFTDSARWSTIVLTASDHFFDGLCLGILSFDGFVARCFLLGESIQNVVVQKTSCQHHGTEI